MSEFQTMILGEAWTPNAALTSRLRFVADVLGRVDLPEGPCFLVLRDRDARPEASSLERLPRRFGRQIEEAWTEGGRGLSREHFEVRQEEGSFSILDLGSRNGTWRNGDRVDGETPLRDGDLIEAGGLLFVANLPDPEGP